MEGLILRGIGGFYTVMDGAGARFTLRAQAKIRRKRLTPTVGDRVLFMPGRGADEEGWLEEILPRKNLLIRPPVANVDLIALVIAAGAPEPDLLLIDRLLICCRICGIAPLLVVNKSDMDAALAESLLRQYAGAEAESFRVCARTGAGVEALRERLRGTVHAFGGQSGVGKSTLINRLYGFDLETGGLSERIERGRHTTRHAELIPVAGGGMVLDTPGFSQMELERMDPLLLKDYYPEFLPYEEDCRFHPCRHDKDKGCAVRRAVEAGAIDRERYRRYGILLNEMTERWKNRYD